MMQYVRWRPPLLFWNLSLGQNLLCISSDVSRVFWADQCRYQAHKGTTIVGAEGRNFQNFCLQIILKMHPLALPVLRFLCNIFQITWAYLRKILFHGWFFKIPCRVWLNRLWMGRDLRFTRFWIFLILCDHEPFHNKGKIRSIRIINGSPFWYIDSFAFDEIKWRCAFTKHTTQNL